MRVEAAEEMARTLLSVLPRRLLHVASVARTAGEVDSTLGLDPVVVVSAAWLHDIGYAPTIAETGLHPLDGARFLRDEGVDERLVNLVAHHSHAAIEAKERGVTEHLRVEFPKDASLPHDALCYCDMTTGPDGQRMTAHERLTEIRERYGPGNVVFRFITRAEPVITKTVHRVESQLKAATQST